MAKCNGSVYRDQTSGQQTQTGVSLTLPADYNSEVWNQRIYRAPSTSSSGNTIPDESNETVIAEVGSNRQRYFDPRPSTGSVWWYSIEAYPNVSASTSTYKPGSRSSWVGLEATAQRPDQSLKGIRMEQIQTGQLQAGEITNRDRDAGIRVGSERDHPTTSGWSTYLDLEAGTASDDTVFHHHDSLNLYGDGSADFGGEVSTHTFTADGTATFSGRVFVGKSARGGRIDHGTVNSSDYTIEAHLGNTHRLSLGTNVNLGIARGGLGNSNIVGTSLVVIIDHSGFTVAWDDSLGLNGFYASGSTNPSGAGRSVYACTCFDHEDLGLDAYWAIGLGAENVSAI